MERDPRIAEKAALGVEPNDAQFRLLVASVADYAIFLMDATGRIASWNAGARRIKGYRTSEIIGRHLSLFYTEEDRVAGVPGRLLARAEAEGRARHEGWRVRKDGSRFWADVVVTALRDPQGALRGFAKVTRDMTAHREIEQSLLALTRRLVEAEEAERRRLAAELHDRVGQSLSALNMNLDMVALQMFATADESTRERLRDSLALVEQTLQTIENVMAELRPPLLDEYGLGAALAHHVEAFSRRTGVRVELDDAAKEGSRALRTESALALFRIAQEALSNVAKHADAHSVRVSLEMRDGQALLAVVDDGQGFDPDAPKGRRWGMTTMRERAAAVGGSIDVLSALGQGTAVRVSVPGK
jgi:PAS domain S-box-containing protein